MVQPCATPHEMRTYIYIYIYRRTMSYQEDDGMLSKNLVRSRDSPIQGCRSALATSIRERTVLTICATLCQGLPPHWLVCRYCSQTGCVVNAFVFDCKRYKEEATAIGRTALATGASLSFLVGSMATQASERAIGKPWFKQTKHVSIVMPRSHRKRLELGSRPAPGPADATLSRPAQLL